ncbi:MAG: dehypoxanthine futalosine cyclase [Planctomycetes bacterium]|nr:dehypoxanthine futalosine cyclase [Planctomycetota bacterium]
MSRIGCITYLNARPLSWTLPQRAPDAACIFDTPKAVSDRLARGDVDAALVPVADLFEHPSWRVAQGVAIASRGAAESVRLFHRVPREVIRAVALDPSSKTSNLLAQVLLAEVHGLRPQYVPLSPQSAGPTPPPEFDAFVCIGDRTFAMRAPGWESWDLGSAWEALTGKPFVFAVWAMRPRAVERAAPAAPVGQASPPALGGAGGDARATVPEHAAPAAPRGPVRESARDSSLHALAEALRLAKEDGVARLAEIAAAESVRLGLDRSFCLRYLSEVLWYTLGPDEQAGLLEFNRRAAAFRLCPTMAAIPFLEPASSAGACHESLDPGARRASGAAGSPRGSGAPGVRRGSGAGPPEASDPDRVAEIGAKVHASERITPAEAEALLGSDDLALLGAAAQTVRNRLHPTDAVTYAVDRNINYSNVCVTYCDFCAFYRVRGDAEAYVLPREVIFRKIDELSADGGTHILMQGGHHPDLRLEWYEDLLRAIRKRFPAIAVHSFSAPEVCHFAAVESLPVRTVLERLKAAGLHSLPGGGAEILDDEVRKRISPLKCTTDQWLEVHRAAHGIGLRSTSTMMFGVGETRAHRVAHLERLRNLQDETGGFTAFIGWTFQPDNTRLAAIPPAGAHDYLKTLAVARCFLDNIPTVQSSWVTQGAKIGQVALSFGADDMGSTMLEENVVSSAGTTHRLNKAELIRQIEDAGYRAVQRDCCFRPVTAGGGAPKPPSPQKQPGAA